MGKYRNSPLLRVTIPEISRTAEPLIDESKELAQPTTEENVSQPNKSSVGIGKDGIKIESSVIGLLILIISIAFFFLYLQFVFQINEI